MHRVRIGSAINVCRATLPLSPHGVLSSTNAPKVPHFIGVAVGQGQSATPWRGRGERGGRRIPEVFVGAMPSSTSDFEKRTSSRCLPSDALSYQTNRTSQTGRTARMTLGVYLGEIHLRACRPRRGRCTGLGISGWGAANSFTGIRLF